MTTKLTYRTLGELPIKIGDGNYSSKYPKASEFLSYGVPFISASDLVNGRIQSSNLRYISPNLHRILTKGHLKAGDILLVTRGNGVGLTAYVDSEYADANINAQLVLLRADNKELNSRFLYYLLSSPEYYGVLKAYGSGSAQPQLPIGSLLRVGIKYPQYQDQVAIADILGSLDDKIELNRRMNATLEESARALFKSWFVDFDPARAKMEGRQPEGIDAETAALFPDRLVESELGLIPEGWHIGALKHCCQRIENGGTPKRDQPQYWQPETVPWLTSGEVLL